MSNISGTTMLTVYPEADGTLRYVFEWTATSGGVVQLNMEEDICGTLLKLETRPLASPTLGYDVTLENLNGTDVLYGKGLNRSGSANEFIHLYEGLDGKNFLKTSGRHRFKVANAGSTTTGIASIWVMPEMAVSDVG